MAQLKGGMQEIAKTCAAGSCLNSCSSGSCNTKGRRNFLKNNLNINYYETKNSINKRAFYK